MGGRWGEVGNTWAPALQRPKVDLSSLVLGSHFAGLNPCLGQAFPPIGEMTSGSPTPTSIVSGE